ncbi:MAG: M23 family metallopeptidase [Bacteroidales bacterium]
MASNFFDKNQDNWKEKYSRKYRIAVQNDNTFEERASIKVSRVNVITIVIVFTFLIVGITSSLIMFTPIRELIPGYSKLDLSKDLYKMNKLADSAQNSIRQNQIYLSNIKRIIEGKEPKNPIQGDSITNTSQKNYDTILDRKSQADSLLRNEYEKNLRNNSFGTDNNQENQQVGKEYGAFLPPIKGFITDKYQPGNGHFGIDVVAKENEAVKCVKDGTVFFSDWTSDNGHVLIIQHPGNYLSIYKHNSVLLKKTGEHVKAGEAIAIIGESGQLATGPHLHFELWYNGMPVDPQKYMVF